MIARPFKPRPCPGCGSDRSAEEVCSDPRAESLSPDVLRRFWSGFHDDKVFFSYHRCHDCGLMFAPRYFDDGELAELYSDLAENMYVVPPAAIEATQRAYFDEAAKGGRLSGGYLEIGPDVGHVVKQAARKGNFDRFWLFEPNRSVHERLARNAEPHPHHVHAAMDDLSPVPTGSVGLAVMIHVLDHLLDPLAMLDQIRRTLRPGGKLLIVTHNEQSLLRRLTGRRWPPFCLQHPAIFSPASITGLLRRSGYCNVRVKRSVNYYPFSFLARQAGRALGLGLEQVPMPDAVIGLRLGNMITLAVR